ncbi:hypothetical protein O7632_20410 [Solwaraspora sp. WMMD406]|uniref:hypothetical protein n=1 Tax=Solwaraspora sp. WMMD406 TaxID=3016095 RepID=UPI002415ECB8|nr:hypothetical protein [Solwaraspora sp. WMMD406]MDG4766444.1 hypothetical protein [Solwaraspora sp. WMMD406]
MSRIAFRGSARLICRAARRSVTPSTPITIPPTNSATPSAAPPICSTGAADAPVPTPGCQQDARLRRRRHSRSLSRRCRLDDLLITLIGAAGKAAWKLPKETADPFELAAPEVRKFVRAWRDEHGER